MLCAKLRDTLEGSMSNVNWCSLINLKSSIHCLFLTIKKYYYYLLDIKSTLDWSTKGKLPLFTFPCRLRHITLLLLLLLLQRSVTELIKMYYCPIKPTTTTAAAAAPPPLHLFARQQFTFTVGFIPAVPVPIKPASALKLNWYIVYRLCLDQRG